MMEKKPNKTLTKVRLSIVEWNKNYPLDYFWRKKYGVRFNSELHRHTSFLDMLRDFEEDRVIEFLESRKKKPINQQTEMSDEEFDSLDLSQFDDA